MIWKILIVILVLDLVKRIIQYGPYELRNVINYFRYSLNGPNKDYVYFKIGPGVNKDSSEQDQTINNKEKKEEHIADFIESSMSQQRKKNCI